MATGPDVIKPVFNDDLFTNAGDLETAQKLYGPIAFVLDHPELRAVFLRYDDVANRAKRRRLRSGWLAVILGAVSLSLAAGLLLFHTELRYNDWPRGTLAFAASLIAAIAGVGSVVLAVGIMSRPAKMEWLCARLMTERLRQLHFQALAAWAPEILAAAHDETAKERLLAERDLWLARFLAFHEDKLPAELNNILEGPEHGEFWLHRNLPAIAVDPVDPVLVKLFTAYRDLRISHQLQYASYKLGELHTFLPTLPRSQSRVFSFASFFCIALLLLSDIGGASLSICDAVGWCGSAPKSVVVDPGKIARDAPTQGSVRTPGNADMPLKSEAGHAGPDADMRTSVSPSHIISFIHLFALILAVIVLAVRALEEGLKPEREVERYVKYRSAILRVDERFRRAESSQARLEVMRDMEHLAFDEMCDFLRTHKDARFVM